MDRGRGNDRDRDKDRSYDRGRDRDGRDKGSSLGKRPFDDRGDRRHDSTPGQLHFRMLVGVKKAGSVIGKGGDFIQLTKKMTGAKVAVDKPIHDRQGRAEDRLVHVEGADEPSKELPGVQDAVLRTAERILGDENQDDGSIKLPHKCHLRMLLYKHQIGMVMGKKGSTINEMRNKSSATIKLVSPANGVPIVPCALPDDEMVTIAGTPDQTLTALKMITDKLRAVSSATDFGPSSHHDYSDRGSPADKRSRGEAPPPGYGPPPGALPPGAHLGAPPGAHLGAPPGAHLGAPPGAHLGAPPGAPPGAHPGAPPAANVISMALPHQARNVLDNNDSVKTDGLTGLATVEYKLLVPVRRSGVILGSKGGIINDIRNRTGARVNLFDEERHCGDRMLQIMSTEDVQDQHCAAFDAAMDCVQALLHDELQAEPVGTIRIILPHGQVGAVMGKKGATIKELRSLSGASLQLSSYPDVPGCVKKGEEVLEMRGSRNAVLLATHVVLVAVRGNMARGQLIYNYPLPQNAPPPSPRGPPPPHMHMGPPADPRSGPQGVPLGAPHPGMQGVPGGPGPDVRPRGSRWDSAEPRGNNDPGAQQRQPLPGPPGVAGQVPGARPGVVYAHAPPEVAAVPHPQPQVQYVQGPPPQGVQQQPGMPPQHVQYVQGPPPVQQQHQQPPPAQQQQQQQGVPVPQPQQVVVYTSQPPPGATYAPQQQVYMQQQQPPQAQAQPQPQQAPAPPQHGQQVHQVVEYVGAGGTTTYVHGPPPSQQQPAGLGQPTVVYHTVSGQPPHYVDPNTQQQVALPPPPQQQVVTSAPPGTTTVVHGQPPQQVTYIYTQAPPPSAAPAQDAGVPGAAAAAHGAAPGAAPGVSGPASASGYGGLAGLMAAAAAPQAAAPAAAPPPAPKARVLLTQDQVVRLRLDDPQQTTQLSALSGATITLSDHILENGAREVLLAGTDAQCNTATNLMEALMKSA